MGVIPIVKLEIEILVKVVTKSRWLTNQLENAWPRKRTPATAATRVILQGLPSFFVPRKETEKKENKSLCNVE